MLLLHAILTVLGWGSEHRGGVVGFSILRSDVDLGFTVSHVEFNFVFIFKFHELCEAFVDN